MWRVGMTLVHTKTGGYRYRVVSIPSEHEVIIEWQFGPRDRYHLAVSLLDHHLQRGEIRVLPDWIDTFITNYKGDPA